MPPTDSFDVVIVGAGAAGCVLARRLAERGDLSILLLEAGPDMRSATPTDFRDGWRLPEIPDWGYRSEPLDSGETLRVRRGRVVGGTSWLTRFAVRGAPADFDAWAARGNPGWSFEDVLPVFRRTETDAEFGDRPWHGDSGPVPITRYPDLEPTPIHAAAVAALVDAGFPEVPDHNAPDAIGVGRMPFSGRNGIRATATDAFLPTSLPLPSLTLHAGAAVTHVVLEQGRAIGVRLVDGTEIGADRVILAAGTYGSPTILLRSGIGSAEQLQKAGIPVIVDLPGVGSNLADHPQFEIDVGWRGHPTTGPVLHSLATFRSSLTSASGAPDLAIWIADPIGDEPTFSLEVLLMKARSRGTVSVRSADPEDPPRIELPGLREPADVERMAEAYEIAVDLANHPAIRRLANGSPPVDPGSRKARGRAAAEMYYSIPHTVGTCRMGPSAEDGDVVDALGRVHGVERLSVVDASVIPDAPAGFPHLVTIMLADLLAERLTTLD